MNELEARITEKGTKQALTIYAVLIICITAISLTGIITGQPWVIILWLIPLVVDIDLDYDKIKKFTQPKVETPKKQETKLEWQTQAEEADQHWRNK